MNDKKQQRIRKAKNKKYMWLLLPIIFIPITIFIFNKVKQRKEFESINTIVSMYEDLHKGKETTYKFVPSLNYLDIYIVPKVTKRRLEGVATFLEQTSEIDYVGYNNDRELAIESLKEKGYSPTQLSLKKQQNSYFANAIRITKKQTLISALYNYNASDGFLLHNIIRVNTSKKKEIENLLKDSETYIGAISVSSTSSWDSMNMDTLTVFEIDNEHVAAIYIIPQAFDNKVSLVLDVFPYNSEEKTYNSPLTTILDISEVSRDEYEQQVYELRRSVISDGKGIYY